MKKMTSVFMFCIAATGLFNARGELNDGLVASYPLDGNANDVSGNALNGVLAGVYSPTSNRFGDAVSAYAFDGGALVVSNLPVNSAQMYTLAFWMYLERYDVGAAIGELSIGTTCGGPQMAQVYSNIYFHSCGSPVNSNQIMSSVSNLIGRWRHVVAVISNSSTKTYADGVAVSTATMSWPLISPVRMVLSNSRTLGDPTKIRLDDVRVYNRALSSNEVFSLASYTDGSSRYVSPTGGNVPPYTNWAMAALRIQDAVDAAAAGDTVIVTDGVYSAGTKLTPGYALSNRVVASNAVVIRSVNGPAVTTIDGLGSVRGVYLTGAARLEGFTVSDGATMTGGTFPHDRNGGGVYLTGGASISNCVLESNTGLEGGGLYILTSGYADNCLIQSNHATAGGGGVRFSDAGNSAVRNSRIIRNTSPNAGGVHIYHSGRLQNCLIADNVGSQDTGGVFIDWGSQGAFIENCTIAGNSSPINGGIGHVINGPTVRNSIIFGNSSGNWSAGSFLYCVTTPEPTGAGNSTNDPLFADADYRIGASSPCVNAGSNGLAVGTADLDGNDRILYDTVDIGAYEFAASGSVTVSAPDSPSGPVTGLVGSVLSFATGGSICSDGGAPEYRFDWGDGSYSTWGSGTDSHAWTEAGSYVVKAQARCITNLAAVSSWSAALTVSITSLPPVSGDRYVSLSGAHAYPFTNWVTAATNIQAAVNAANPGESVIVTDGVYNVGMSVTPGYTLPNRVRATNGVVIRSVNGPASTVIEGQGPEGSSAVRGVYLAGGARLEGFTIAGGGTFLSGTFPYERNGGGVYLTGGASISNCVVKNNSAYEGGGIYILYSGYTFNSAIESNYASAGGGGVRFTDAGASAVRNSRIVGNTSPNAGGVHIYHSGRLQNCLIADNVGSQNTGGVFVDWGSQGAFIENCTIAGNSAPVYGGIGHVVNGPTVRNSIIYGNSGGNWSAGSFSYSDTTPLPSGAGNISGDPLFADGAYRISALSPCANAGQNSYVIGDADLDGNSRIVSGVVDMGAYEVGGGGPTVSTPAVPSGATTSLVFAIEEYSSGGSSASDGSAVEYRFDWGDGGYSSWGSSTNSHAWLSSGSYSVRAQARCVTNVFAMSSWSDNRLVTVTSPPPVIQTHYVSLTGSSVPPYTNWATAATNIQAAINVSISGDAVVVTDGVYSVGAALTPGYGLPNRVVATNSISIRSVNGPASTVIEGQGPEGASAVRGVYLAGGARLEGFTIAGGGTFLSGTFPYERNGGGVYLTGGASISNCVVKNNSAYEGGGIYILYSGYTFNSAIESNYASAGGGGVRFTDAGASAVRNSRIVGNTSPNAGGVHIYHSGRLQNCLIADNTGSQNTGGVFVDWGSQGAFIENCTIAGNSAPVYGGLGYVINGASVRNSIIFGNNGGNWSGGNYTYCDTTPLPAGVGNISTDPLFGDSQYRLAGGSPCINAGNNGLATEPTDLDGNSRILNGIVDMGAYEFAGYPVTITPPQVPSGPATGLVYQTLAFASSGATSSDGCDVEYRFDWGDGSLSDWGSAIRSNTWTEPGIFAISAQARCVTNAAALSAWSDTITLVTVQPPSVPTVRYVAKTGTAVPPYTNWATAALNIQDAIAISSSGDSIYVDDGIYAERINFLGKTISLASRLALDGDASHVSQTIIDGGDLGRVVTFSGGEGPDTLLAGFTITNGYAQGAAPGGHGGGIGCFSAEPRLQDLVIAGNRADQEGGGIYMAHSSPTLRNVSVRGNLAANGGGIRVSYGAPEIANIRVEENNGPDGGGGLLLYHSDASIRNSLIRANETSGEGGGLFFDASSPLLESVTIVGNIAPATKGAGLAVSYSSHPKLLNSIVWGNGSEEVAFNTSWFGMALTVSYSDVKGGTNGILTSGLGPVHWLDGNLTNDPSFVGGADYHLQPGSTCANAGTNQEWMATDTDLDGNSRIVDSLVDMGCFELQTNAIPISKASVTCHLEPAKAREVGAKWRIAGETDWLESGKTVYLPTGEYSVAFADIPAWSEPADIAVLLGSGSNVIVTGTYIPTASDATPPVIVHIAPPDGHVSNGNQIPMTIIATDDVAVVSVTVNGKAATHSGGNTYHYTVTGVRGTYNVLTIMAFDSMGNYAKQVVNYGQGNSLRLVAMWNGYWKVRNPLSNDVAFIWEVVGSTNESGSGVAQANRESFFNTTLGPKTVVLRVGGVAVDSEESSDLPPPAEIVDEGALDSDGDSVSNRDEELAGTDPNSADSFLSMGLSSTTSGGPGLGARHLGTLNSELSGSVISWQSGVDSVYSAETSTNLATWTPSPAFQNVPGTGVTMGYTNGFGEERQLYLRIRATKKP